MYSNLPPGMPSSIGPALVTWRFSGGIRGVCAGVLWF